MIESAHGAFVDAWLDRFPKDLRPAQEVALFEQAVGAVFQRVHVVLGEVTLGAIADRVLSEAQEKFPELAPLRIDGDGIRWDELPARAESFDGGALRAALRFLLVEFLTSLGNLTAEILTPALHGELSKVTVGSPDEPERPESEQRGGATS